MLWEGRRQDSVIMMSRGHPHLDPGAQSRGPDEKKRKERGGKKITAHLSMSSQQPRIHLS
jgi:hypothetical protein